ncbi:MAG: hypothetical protein M5U34_31295 [Chloroflexi bacterium]|nr:hypothetical protein [Chloroflexota bacterium]
MIEAIYSQTESETAVLFLFFSGIWNKEGPPPFEFLRSTQSLDAKRIYIRDPYQLWYQKGLPGMADSLDGCLPHLQKLITTQSVHKTVVCGNSMGGYAAILFGALLNADEVHAFSPKTFITPWKRLVNLDFWLKNSIRHKDITLLRKLWALQHKADANKAYFDLKDVLKQANGHTRYHLYFAQSHRLDRLHSRRLVHKPNVYLYPYPYYKHDLVKHLQKGGKLEALWQKARHTSSLSQAASGDNMTMPAAS